MIPFIIINGKSSKDVDGLLIQSLPPITKPVMRNLIEEIDGRDGDIITTLGYGAYDKTFTIGLRGSYNVDDVIGFLNQDGTIIFSNEMDKYYNFTMLELIDFEKLLRYKTADVTIHVQPFKYGVADGEQNNLRDNLLTFPTMTFKTNGVMVEVSNEGISVIGTHAAPTEVYIPINDLTLTQGNYRLTATANNVNNLKLRLITNTPTSSSTFGGNAVTLTEDETATINASISNSVTYNYLWLYLGDSNVNENFTITTSLINTDNEGELKLFNRGNIYSRPTLTIVGDGDIELFINGVSTLNIALGDLGQITIDSVNMNAYNGDTYLNRYVTGDYDNVRLKVGSNIISWSGNVSYISANYISRWL